MSSTNRKAMNGGVAAVCVRGPMRGMVRLNIPPAMVTASSSSAPQQEPTLLSPLPLPPRLVHANPIQLQLSKQTIKQILESDKMATEEKYEKLKQIVESELLERGKKPNQATPTTCSSQSKQRQFKESTQSKQSTQPKQSKKTTQSNSVTQSKQSTQAKQETQSKQATQSKEAQSKQSQQATVTVDLVLTYEKYEKGIGLIKRSIESDPSICPKKLSEMTGIREQLVRRIIKKFFFIRYINGRFREINSARKIRMLAENRLIYEDDFDETTCSSTGSDQLLPTCEHDLSV